nr:MAG TPA: hypothetical protein [Caudoviricetes sp.]
MLESRFLVQSNIQHLFYKHLSNLQSVQLLQFYQQPYL